jgi:hypothetical protein
MTYYSVQHKRFRGNLKRLRRIRWSVDDKRMALLLTVLVLLSVALGGWLGFEYKD